MKLYRDGELVIEGDYFQILALMHKRHSYSLDHALKYEGYTLETGADK